MNITLKHAKAKFSYILITNIPTCSGNMSINCKSYIILQPNDKI